MGWGEVRSPAGMVPAGGGHCSWPWMRGVSSPGGLASGLWCFTLSAGLMQALDRCYAVPRGLEGSKQWGAATQKSRGWEFGTLPPPSGGAFLETSQVWQGAKRGSTCCPGMKLPVLSCSQKPCVSTGVQHKNAGTQRPAPHPSSTGSPREPRCRAEASLQPWGWGQRDAGSVSRSGSSSHLRPQPAPDFNVSSSFEHVQSPKPDDFSLPLASWHRRLSSSFLAFSSWLLDS